MKPHPPPKVPGKTEAERMDNAVRKMFAFPKVELERFKRATRPKKRVKKARRRQA